MVGRSVGRSYTHTSAQCSAVKLCVQRCADCNNYPLFIFVLYANHENIFIYDENFQIYSSKTHAVHVGRYLSLPLSYSSSPISPFSLSLSLPSLFCSLMFYDPTVTRDYNAPILADKPDMQ